MNVHQQFDKKFLLYESQIDPNTNEKPSFLHEHIGRNKIYFWSDRIVLVEYESTNEHWNFMAFDLFTSESQQIRLRKFYDNDIIYIYQLNDKFGFMKEYGRGKSITHFVELDWTTCEFRIIDQVQTHWTHVDKLESTKFVLESHLGNGIFKHQIGTLKNGQIKLGVTCESNTDFHFYSKNRLVKFNRNLGQPQIITYNLTTKNEETFGIDPLPKNFQSFSCEWIKDRFYAVVCMENRMNCRFAWTDLENKRWTFLEFETNLYAQEFKLFHGILLIGAESNRRVNGKMCRNETKFYNIQMRRPQFLRNSAWHLVVQIMKNRNEKDPYIAAKEFLPLNSDLRPPWFENVEQNQ